MVADELNREKVTVFGGCVSRSGVLPGGLEWIAEEEGLWSPIKLPTCLPKIGRATVWQFASGFDEDSKKKKKKKNGGVRGGGERQTLWFSRTDRPFKKLPSDPVASPRGIPHLETKRSNEGKTKSERAKTRTFPSP
jgi:hypothetical protein